MATLCLSFHAAYRCRHEGACCSAEWDIEVDPRIAADVAARRVIPVFATTAPFETARDESGRPFIAPARHADGWCGFRHDSRCALQTAGGEATLPLACRHFPRVYLQDARGTLITLSHYCPTAAAMLFGDGDTAITEAPSPLAMGGDVEGLDARDALPPLLRPGMLMDHSGYDTWERLAIRELVTCASADDALARVAAATERLRRWSPADGRLDEAATRAFERLPTLPGAPALSPGFSLVRAITGPHPLLDVPDGLETAWVQLRADGGADFNRAIGRYLAAALFGNWVAYRGQGLRSIVEWLRAVHDVLRVQAVRRARTAGDPAPVDTLREACRMSDYLVVHTVDSLAFGRAVAVVE